MGFKSVISVVEDVLESRKLYENLLGCEVKGDFGINNVGFEGGLALYKKSLFTRLIGNSDIKVKVNNLSVYFEFDDIISIRDKIINYSFELLHDIKEQPWGQKAFRFYDRDEHIVEIAESMDIVLKNMYSSGKTVKEISKKTSYTIEAVLMDLKRLKAI